MNPDGSILLYEGTEGVAATTREVTGSPLTHAALLCYPALWDVQLRRVGPFGLYSRPRKLLPVGKLLLPAVRLKVRELDCKKLDQRLQREEGAKAVFHPFGTVQLEVAWRTKNAWCLRWSCAEWIIHVLADVGILCFPGEENKTHAPYEFLRSPALMRLPD
jgi:hypothetical protein